MKEKLGDLNALYPTPTTIVGALVNDRPNFIAIVFVGEIVQTHVDESVLTDGKVDISKLKPLLFDMTSKKYWSLGGEIAKCWNVGKKLKQ